MIIGLILFVLALVVPDFYIWDAWLQPNLSSGWLAFWILPTAAILFAFFAANRGWAHNTFMRMLFAMVLLLAVPKLIFTLLAPWAGWQTGVAGAAIIVALLAYGMLWGWRRIITRQAVCTSPLLPRSFDGYRILQLSDLHIGTFLGNPKFIEKLVRLVNAEKPDVIVFTGDLVNVQATEVLPFIHMLGQMHAPDGIYSVMGNHDYCEYGRDHSALNIKRNQRVLEYIEEKIGWHLLLNSHVLISRQSDGTDKESIALIGVENISKPPFPNYGNLGEAMKGLPAGMFKVLLSHDPTHWRLGVLHQTDIALTLSGHTHAGQIKIGKFSPAKWAYHEWGGKYTEGGSMLYVSLGLGGTMPFRFGAWPEINIITLHSAKRAE